MTKSITYLTIFIFFNCFFFSCKTVEKVCFKSKSDWNYQIEKILDTTKLYVETELISKVRDSSDLFLKNENKLIEKNRPAIKFYGNGKFDYYTQTVSPNYSKMAIHGQYRIYNDTIQTCRQFWSAQSGKYYESEFFIINSEGILQTVSNDIISVYKKL
jgi:hypothetical protein